MSQHSHGKKEYVLFLHSTDGPKNTPVTYRLEAPLWRTVKTADKQLSLQPAQLYNNVCHNVESFVVTVNASRSVFRLFSYSDKIHSRSSHNRVKTSTVASQLLWQPRKSFAWYTTYTRATAAPVWNPMQIHAEQLHGRQNNTTTSGRQTPYSNSLEQPLKERKRSWRMMRMIIDTVEQSSTLAVLPTKSHEYAPVNQF